MARKYGLNGIVGPVRGFTWGEVRCKCNCSLPTDRKFRKRVRRQARSLNRLRNRVRRYYGGKQLVRKVTIISNSWYRCPAHNAAVGGASRSKHLTGIATDIVVIVRMRSGNDFTVPTTTLHQLARGVRAFRRGGRGQYRTFNHLDAARDADRPAAWFG